MPLDATALAEILAEQVDGYLRRSLLPIVARIDTAELRLEREPERGEPGPAGPEGPPGKAVDSGEIEREITAQLKVGFDLVGEMLNAPVDVAIEIGKGIALLAESPPIERL